MPTDVTTVIGRDPFQTAYGHRFLVDADCHPQTLAVLTTRAEPVGIELGSFPGKEKVPRPDRAAVLADTPNGDVPRAARVPEEAG